MKQPVCLDLVKIGKYWPRYIRVSTAAYFAVEYSLQYKLSFVVALVLCILPTKLYTSPKFQVQYLGFTHACICTRTRAHTHTPRMLNFSIICPPAVISYCMETQRTFMLLILLSHFYKNMAFTELLYLPKMYFGKR